MSRQKTARITAILLVLGLGAAAVIFLTAQPVAIDPLLGEPLETKKYVHELRVMGGQGNVLAAEFMDWFAGLWHGRTLAGTVAVLTIVVTLSFRFVASLAQPSSTDARDDRNRPAGSK